jgi:LPS export ABC transporter protein LptC/lipopolysaccharide transport protein LptA
MKSYLRVILLVGLVAVFFQILISFPILIENQDELTIQTKDEKNVHGSARQKMEGVHLVESQAGTRDWELFSETAETQQDSNRWQIKKVKVHFYRKDKLDFVGVGTQGSINTNTKDLEIKGSVVLTSSNGYRLETEQIRYHAKKRLLQSSSPVKMLGPSEENAQGILVSGDSMDIHVAEGNLNLFNNVEAKKQMRDGKTLLIKSNKAEFSSKSKTVSFHQNVQLKIYELRVEAPSAQFQYSKDGKILESLRLFGGTKVSDLDKVATSDAVTFFPKENKFILEGKPRVVQNNDEILGEVITFLNGGKKVKVQNIRAKIEK